MFKFCPDATVTAAPLETVILHADKGAVTVRLPETIAEVIEVGTPLLHEVPFQVVEEPISIVTVFDTDGKQALPTKALK